MVAWAAGTVGTEGVVFFFGEQERCGHHLHGLAFEHRLRGLLLEQRKGDKQKRQPAELNEETSPRAFPFRKDEHQTRKRHKQHADTPADAFAEGVDDQDDAANRENDACENEERDTHAFDVQQEECP